MTRKKQKPDQLSPLVVGKVIESFAREILEKLREVDPELSDDVFLRLGEMKDLVATWNVPPFGLCLYMGEKHNDRARALMDVIGAHASPEDRQILQSGISASTGDLAMTNVALASLYSHFPFVTLRTKPLAWENIHAIECADDEWWDLFRLLACLSRVVVAPFALQGGKLREDRYLARAGAHRKTLHIFHPFVFHYDAAFTTLDQKCKNSWGVTDTVEAIYFAAGLSEPSKGFFRGGKRYIKDSFDKFLIAIEKDHPEAIRQARDPAGRSRVSLSDPLVEEAFDQWSGGAGTPYPVLVAFLGAFAGKAGDFDTAISLIQRATDRLRKESGDSNADVFRLNDMKAMLLAAKGDARSARTIQEELLAARRRALGEKHDDTLASICRLARTLAALGEKDEAIRLYATAYDAYRDAGGADRREAVESLEARAMLLRGQGEVHEAVEALERVLAARERTQSENNEAALRTAYWLAEGLSAQGQSDRSVQLLERVATGRSRLLGENHADTMKARKDLESTRSMMKVAEKMREALALSESLAGRGLSERSVDVLRQTLDYCKRSFSIDSILTVSVKAALSRVLWRQGCEGEARAMLDEVIVERRRILGSDHPDTREAVSLSCAMATGLHQRVHIRDGLRPIGALDPPASPPRPASASDKSGGWLQELLGELAALGCLGIVVLVLLSLRSCR